MLKNTQMATIKEKKNYKNLFRSDWPTWTTRFISSRKQSNVRARVDTNNTPGM